MKNYAFLFMLSSFVLSSCSDGLKIKSSGAKVDNKKSAERKTSLRLLETEDLSVVLDSKNNIVEPVINLDSTISKKYFLNKESRIYLIELIDSIADSAPRDDFKWSFLNSLLANGFELRSDGAFSVNLVQDSSELFLLYEVSDASSKDNTRLFDIYSVEDLKNKRREESLSSFAHLLVMSDGSFALTLSASFDEELVTVQGDAFLSH